MFRSETEVGVTQSDYTCDYDPGLLLDKADSLIRKTTKLSMLRWIEVKDFYMHMLLYINEDFDDDLLMETLEALDCI